MRLCRYIFPIVLLFIIGAVTTVAQQAPVIGTVTDATDGDPVAGVIIEVLDSNGNMVSYAMSASDGRFTITPPAGSYTLRFSAMGYRKLTIDPAKSSRPLVVALVQEATEIREITVKAHDILMKGDTLVYNVEKYADISDRNIEDVLKKMPGIEVSESGQISYQGEPINKFYIEGIDMLDGRYGLATKNISHKDVLNVELMENHQPIRALQEISHSDQAALNIRLKEEAKSRWVGTVNAGAGYSPALYDASLFAMRISGGWQSMENIKVNNTGKNLANENLRFSTYNMFSELVNRNLSPELISADISSAPIGDERTRFNRSVLANSTNAVNAGKDYRIDAEVNYFGERLSSSSETATRYFDPGVEDFHEIRDVLTHIHDLTARITAEANKPEFYLRNDLETGLMWKDSRSRIGGTTSTLQDADLPLRQVSNRLQVIKRTGRRTFTVNSDNRYQATPRSLAIDRDGEELRQDASYSVFNSQTDISYGFGAGRWQLSGRAGIMFRYNTLESTMSGLQNTGLPTVNDITFFQTRTFLTPTAVYQRKKIRFTLTAPLNLRTYNYTDRQSDKGRSKAKLSVDPTAALRYNISAFLTLNTSASYSTTAVNEQIFYNGAIMRDYRNITIGHTLFDSGSRRSISAGLNYRNPVKSLFMSGLVSYTNSSVMPLSARYFTDGYIVSTYSDRRGSSGTWYGKFSFAKGLNSGRTTVGVDVSATAGASSMVLEQVKTPYRSQYYLLTPHFKGRILPWMTAEYRLDLSRDILEIKNGGEKSDYYSASQSLSTVFRITPDLQFNAVAEHYFTDLTGNGDRNLILLDAGIRWNLSQNLDLSLSAANILNKKNFNYSTLASLSSSETRYAIRRRSVVVSAYFTF